LCLPGPITICVALGCCSCKTIPLENRQVDLLSRNDNGLLGLEVLISRFYVLRIANPHLQVTGNVMAKES
jgi:hypothetical protein